MNSPERAEPAEKQEAPRSSENLALLYQGLLTGIVRLQAKREHIPDAEVFRRRTMRALQDVERDARAAGYEPDDVHDTHFAVVAFLDSVVLNSTEPGRAEWERKTLQEELFGQTDAGVVFFEKLERLRSRRDSRRLADILEVYLLCLLLGFEGRYSGGLRGELHSIEERVRSRIENIRGRTQHLSPDGLLPAGDPAPTVVATSRFGAYRLIAFAAVLLTILCFLALKLHLGWAADQAYRKLL
jgi:type VI secretion system protein ImpK